MKPVYVLNQNLCKYNLENGIDKIGLDFSSINKTLDSCKEHKVGLKGHTLVWHSQTPDWFFKENFQSDGQYVSREVMIQRLDSFIGQYLTYVQTIGKTKRQYIYNLCKIANLDLQSPLR